MDDKDYTILLRMPRDWRAKIVKAAKQADLTASAWIRAAIISALKRQGKW